MNILKAQSSLKGGPENIRSSYNAAKIVDTEHERFHSGRAWSHSELHIVSAGSYNWHFLSVHSATHFRAYDFASTVGPCGVYVYEYPYFNANSLGQSEPVYNRNRTLDSIITRPFSLFNAPFVDVNSLGTEIDFALIEQSLGGPIGARGGDIQGLGEWILPASYQCLIGFVNSGTAAAMVSAKFVFYKPTD